jgi:hypothetical protein
MKTLQLLSDIGIICKPSRNFSVRKSEIPNSGKGLFANSFIAENSILFIAFAPKGDNGQSNTSLMQAAASLADDEHSEERVMPVFEARYVQLFPNDFVNHSEKPNCETAIVGELFFVRSLRDILPNEELTKDYRHTMKLIKDIGFYLADDFMNF